MNGPQIRPAKRRFLAHSHPLSQMAELDFAPPSAQIANKQLPQKHACVFQKLLTPGFGPALPSVPEK